MTREERLEFCKVCLHRKMNMQKGLLCKLTNDLADFEGSCPNYDEDIEEKGQKLQRDLIATGHQNAGNSLDPKKNKENGAIIFFIGVGILYFTITNVDNYGIIIIPFGAILLGARKYLKGVEQEKVLEKQQKINQQKTKSNNN